MPAAPFHNRIAIQPAKPAVVTQTRFRCFAKLVVLTLVRKSIGVSNSFLMLNFFKRTPLLTQNNHFQYGLSDTDVFTVRLGAVTGTVKSGLGEAVLSAQEIYKKRSGQRLTLCLSGGIDSESMLQAFLKSGADFAVCFMRFKDGLNDFDITTNRELCDRLHIKYFTVELDVIDFFESGKHLHFAKMYRCQSPQICVHLWLMEQIDGAPVFAGNPFVQTIASNGPFFTGLPGDLHCAYFRYLEKNKRLGIPWFFIYSPELCSAFLRTPAARQLQQKRLRPEAFTYLIKCQMYQEAGFDVKPRLDKFTGFERVREHYDKISGTECGVGFDRLFRKPLEKMHPFPKQYLQFVPQNYF